MRLQLKRHCLGVALAAAIVSATFYVPCRVLAAGAANVTLSAPGQTLSPGTQFTITIGLTPNNAIAGAQFNLSFNPSLVSVNNVTEGNLLTQGGASTYFQTGTIDNTVGTVTGVACAIVTPGQTVSTVGALATISMTTRNTSGTCSLNLSNVLVGDINGQSIPVSTTGGQVVIQSTGNPPALAPIGNKSVVAGQSLQFVVSATDADGDTLTYSASNLPTGATFTASTRTFSWTPASAQIGTYTDVLFQVSDGSHTGSENITITVSAPPPMGGGGGGGTGGGAAAAADTTPPVISNVAVVNITKTGATVQWTSDEASTSQVKYASTSEAASSPIPDLVTSHAVDLAGLAPCTAYRFRVLSADGRNNMAESSEYTFATLGEPATFKLSGMKLSATNVSVNQPVVVTVTAMNTGDVQGSYEVNLHLTSSGGSEVMTNTVTLAPSTSEEVTFTVTSQAPGTFQAAIDDLTDSFTVEENNPIPSPQVEIGLFKAIPLYSNGADVSSIGLTYEIVNPGFETDATLVLKVRLDGRDIESLVLFSGPLSSGESKAGQQEYVPANGWIDGAYTLAAELHSGGRLVASSNEEMVRFQTEQPTVVRWYVLAVIIGAMAVAATAVVVVILRRRRELVRNWIGNDRSPR